MIESIKIPLLLSALAVLCGCAAAQPDIKTPEVPVAAQDVTTQAPAPRKLVSARDISLEWRVLFRSPQINEHVNRAFKASPNTEAALATVRRAQENELIRQGLLYSRGSNPPLPDSPGQQGGAQAFYSLHTAQLTVGYVPEVLGIRGTPETAQIQAETQQEAAFFTLSSHVVVTAIQKSALRAQIEAQLNIIGLNRQALEIVHNQFKLGYVTEQEVTQRELDAARAQQALVPLQQQLELTGDLLHMLEGNLPDPDADTEDAFRLEDLRLTRELPQSLSSKLVEQRPDVRAADAQLRVAGAQYGVDIVNTLPRFTVTAATGGPAASPAWMLRDGGKFFDPNGNGVQSIFGANALRSKSRAAQQALNKAAAQYRNVAMAALQDVADTLHVIQADVRALDAAANAAQSAGEVAEQTRKRYEAGSVDFPTMRVAQQNEQLANIDLAQARANRLGDAAALFQALGGRWWKPDETDKTKAAQP